jgi:hypothetical protein
MKITQTLAQSTFRNAKGVVFLKPCRAIPRAASLKAQIDHRGERAMNKLVFAFLMTASVFGLNRMALAQESTNLQMQECMATDSHGQEYSSGSYLKKYQALKAALVRCQQESRDPESCEILSCNSDQH